MATASDYAGGFWAGANASPVLDAFVSACVAVTDRASGQTAGSVGGWTVYASDLVNDTTPAGRPIYGYPVPLDTPAWVAYDLVGGDVLTAGTDFDVSGGYVWFDSDPVTATGTIKRMVWVDGSPVTAVDLVYGSVDPPSTVRYPAATWQALTQTVARACDSPAAAGAETVIDIWQGHDDQWRVITDLAAYRLGSADTPTVGIGDTLVAGQPIGSAWVLTRLGPDKPALTHLTVPAEYHQGVTVGGITWYDSVENTIVDVVGTRTRVRWNLGGSSQADVDDFWTASHATGTAAGATSLAQAMDTRADPVGDPGPESLPTTVNPLEFVCRELFAGNAYVLLVRTDRLGPDAVPAADRRSAVIQAAGPYVTVFEYEDEMPALTERIPS